MVEMTVMGIVMLYKCFKTDVLCVLRDWWHVRTHRHNIQPAHGVCVAEQCDKKKTGYRNRKREQEESASKCCRFTGNFTIKGQFKKTKLWQSIMMTNIKSSQSSEEMLCAML